MRLVQAREAIRLRDDFLSIASHELKTPLTALQLQLGNIRPDTARPGELATRIDRAKRIGDRLARLIDELLDVSRIATGTLHVSLERFDLAEVVRDTVERLRDEAANAGCVLEVDARAPIQGAWDRLRIEQVLTNLIPNALKYAAGKPIAVSAARTNDVAVIEVRDRGPGIAEEDMSPDLRALRARRIAASPRWAWASDSTSHARSPKRTAARLPPGTSRAGACFTVRLPLGGHRPPPP